MRRVRATIVAVEKQICITHSECVLVTFGIQHATRMRNIILSPVAGSTVFLHIISQIVRFSRKNSPEHKMCVLTVSTSFFVYETFLIIRRTERDVIINVLWSSRTAPVIHVIL